jgi:hypothetical protein
MMLSTPKHYGMLMAAFVALCVAFIACAAQLDAPSMNAAAELRKLPPTGDSSLRLGQKFESLLIEKYPELLRDHYDGTPVVSVLFKNDGTVERSSNEIFRGAPDDFRPSEAAYAERFAIKAEEVAYVGLQAMVAPATQTKILIAFTERKETGLPFVSSIIPTPDTRGLDRRIAERYFAAELKNGVSPPERLWVLFDSEGRIMKTGKAMSGSEAINRVLEAQFPGIETDSVTVTPLTDHNMQPVSRLDGKPLQLFSVWLKKGSPPPPV